MLPQSFVDRLRELHRREVDDILDLDAPEVADGGHDPVLRYATVTLATIAVIACLWVTKIIAMPIVAGLVFGLMLGPIVDRLNRYGVPHSVGASVMVVTLLAGFTALLAALAAPLAIWSDAIPDMVQQMKTRLSGLFAFAKQIEGITENLAPSSSAPTVTVADGSTLASAAMVSSAAAGGLLVFFATIYFYLGTRRVLKARLLRLCLGREARAKGGVFFDQIERRVATYFGIVTLINLGMGVITGGIAWYAGLPFPLLFGIAAFVLNYIAFVGPIIMTALLAAAGLMATSNLWVAAWPALAYFVVHLIEGNVVNPVMVGRRMTVSPFLVFVSFMFWLWLWGPLGAILSTPILIIGALVFETLRAQSAADIRDVATMHVPEEIQAEPTAVARAVEDAADEVTGASIADLYADPVPPPLPPRLSPA